MVYEWREITVEEEWETTVIEADIEYWRIFDERKIEAVRRLADAMGAPQLGRESLLRLAEVFEEALIKEMTQ